MSKCRRCGSDDFYLEGGFYFCSECQFQHERKTEAVANYYGDKSTHVQKQKIRKDKSLRGSSSASQITGWTSWEKYNFILIGLTNELIQLGVDPDVKIIIIQLWTRYLKKLEVAFTSKTKKDMPKFSRKYQKADVEIIYGRMRRRFRRKKKRQSLGSSSSLLSSSFTGSSLRDAINKKKAMIIADYLASQSSQGSSISTLTSCSSTNSTKSQRRPRIRYNKFAKLENQRVNVLASKKPKKVKKYFLENYMGSSYKGGPHCLSPMKLLSIIYLALRIINEKIYAADILRYIREGHLSYFKLPQLFPADIELSRAEIDKLNPKCDISHANLRKAIAGVAKFIDVWSIPPPDLIDLVQRYCEELQLPDGFFLYTKRMIAMSPPIFKLTKKDVLYPSYEARAISFIIIVMKLLFGLDGITEYENSRVVKIISSAAEEKELLDSKLFNFCEWQEYIECRRNILVNEHFPTKMIYDPNSKYNPHFYIKFLESQPSKFDDDKDEPQYKSYQYLMRREMAEEMKKGIDQLNECSSSFQDVVTFPPSLTPLHSYLKQLLNDESKSFPSILREDFVSSKIGYILKPELLQGLANDCDMELDVKDQPAHFVEKIVKTFKPPAVPNLRDFKNKTDHNDMVTVVNPEYTTTIRMKSQDPSEYLHQVYSGKIFIDSKRQRLFNKTEISKAKDTFELNQQMNSNNFLFDQVLDNGKLKIPGCDNLDADNLFSNKKLCKLMLSDFEHLTLKKREVINPLDKPVKLRYNFNRDKSGKFIPRSNELDSDVEVDNYVEEEELSDSNESDDEREVIKIIEEDEMNDGDDDDDRSNQEKLDETTKTVENNDDDDIEILENTDKKEQKDGEVEEDNNGEEVLIIEDNVTSNEKEEEEKMKYERLILFRPYKEYWLYRSDHHSHINSTNFHLLERDLPANFRWLLNECAKIIEMNVEDLYKELCFVESYYTDVLSTTNSDNLNNINKNKYNSGEYRSEIHKKKVKTKWKGEE